MRDIGLRPADFLIGKLFNSSKFKVSSFSSDISSSDISCLICPATLLVASNFSSSTNLARSPLALKRHFELVIRLYQKSNCYEYIYKSFESFSSFRGPLSSDSRIANATGYHKNGVKESAQCDLSIGTQHNPSNAKA
uniref:Uncharacterized protein n=1 Tax=Romanomermis culicivorax TaxID=13658 RepID=A0A915KLN9_ROMCU